MFKHLWQRVATNLDTYRSFPRVVGETGGKNMHFVHKSADIHQVVMQTVRSAFEYNGQKCSACSRVYLPDSMWDDFQALMKDECKKLKQGSVNDPENFVTSVINKASYDKIKGYLDKIKSKELPDLEILIGGNGIHALTSNLFSIVFQMIHDRTYSSCCQASYGKNHD